MKNIGFFLGLLLLTACSTAPSQSTVETTIAQTAAVKAAIDVGIQQTMTAAVPAATAELPTATSAPTAAPAATTPPTAAPTSLPEGVLFRDDFQGSLQPGWSWLNEDASRWSFVKDGGLRIIAGDLSMLFDGKAQSNILLREIPASEFDVSLHLTANPTDNFQSAGIYLFEDKDNYIGLYPAFCDVCKVGGKGIFMDYKIGGDIGHYMVANQKEDVYLRLVNKNKVITSYYGFKEGQWTQLGKFGNVFNFKKIGLGATNSDNKNINSDLAAVFHYFEIKKP